MLNQDKIEKQTKLFESLGLSKDDFNIDGYKFYSKMGKKTMSRDYNFASLDDMLNDLVTPMNKEFGQVLIQIVLRPTTFKV